MSKEQCPYLPGSYCATIGGPQGIPDRDIEPCAGITEGSCGCPHEIPQQELTEYTVCFTRNDGEQAGTWGSITSASVEDARAQATAWAREDWAGEQVSIALFPPGRPGEYWEVQP